LRRLRCVWRSRIFVVDWRTLADVCKVGANPHAPEKRWSIKEIITWRAAPGAPLALDVGCRVIGAHLLAMAVDAAVRDVNAAASFRHSRTWRWINIRSFLVHLRIEVADLDRWNQSETRPRKHERAK
jgi:hypothetical protein